MRLLTALLGTSMLMAAGAAQAQTAPAQAEPTAQDSTRIDDIIVTANRREERLQDVPVSVSVVQGEQLERQNINSVENLTRAAPSLELAGPANFGALSIRGIGSLGFSRSSEGSVGVVVDNVALANTSASPPLMFDVQRVEVLEGPQGMLFGRNASAGVINIVTNAPNPAGLEFIAHGDIGSRENYIGRAAINLPVAENAAIRAALSWSQEPRVQQNLFDESWLQREQKAARVRFLWEPSDDLTINLSADYNKAESDGGAPWAVFQSTPGSPLSARLAACGVVVDQDNTEGCINDGSYTFNETRGASAQADLALGDMTLTSITSYREFEGGSGGDVDSVPVTRLVQDVADEISNFSQEFRLTSPSGGKIEYTAGLYYFKSETSNYSANAGPILADLDLIGACPIPIPGFCQAPLGSARTTDTETESYAIFGQATINATDRLRFILGARAGHEDVSAVAPASTTAPGAVAEFAPIAGVNGSVKDDYFSYRLGAQYDVSDQVMVYATYAEGYKGAAINDQAPLPTTPLIVQPEIPKSAEIGIKSSILDGRAVFNATVFRTEVENFQAQFIDVSGGTPAFIYGNADTFLVNGVTAQMLGRPMEGLSINLGVSYISEDYPETYLQPDATGAIVDVSTLGSDEQFKFTSSAEYEWSLWGNLNGFVQADAVYLPEAFSDAARSAVLALNDAWIVGGRIGVRTADGRYGVSIFARNLFDEFRPSARFATPAAAQQLDGASYSQFDSPEGHRLVGLSLDARF